jgi:hypothetical protein
LFGTSTAPRATFASVRERPDSVSSIPLTPENYAAVHEATVKAVARGEFTILDLFDSLPTYRPRPDREEDGVFIPGDPPDTWVPWRAFLCALFGLPMTERELRHFQDCTGRMTPPTRPAREVWCIIGRRGRKSSIAALLAVWRAAFYDYSGIVAPGERAKVPIIAQNKSQAKAIRGFAVEIFKRTILKSLLEDEPSAETISLTTGVDIVITACNLSAGRSHASPMVLLDEVAFFASEDSATPDEDIVRGVKPGMSMIPGAILGGFSSPWAKRGVLYQKFRDHYGKDDGVLVWKASSSYMNPDKELAETVRLALLEDPVGAQTEYNAQFRSDVAAFVPEEVVDAAIVRGRGWLPYDPSCRYFAFCDPSAGVADDMTLGIAHADYARQKVVLDVIQAISPPFEPAEAHRAFAETLKRFGLRFVSGDRFAFGYVADAWRPYQIGYQPSELSRSEIYGDFLPLLMNRQVELPDDPKLRAQLIALDRRTTSNREIIDHPPGGHDDSINSAAGACIQAAKIGLKIKPPESEKPMGTLEEQRAREFQAYLKGLHNPDSSGGGSKWDYLNKSGR